MWKISYLYQKVHAKPLFGPMLLYYQGLCSLTIFVFFFLLLFFYYYYFL